MYYYDIYSKGFYSDEFNQDIPETAAQLTEAEYHSLLQRQAEGGFIALVNGKLTTISQPPSDYHEWNGSEWVISAEKQTAYLAEQRIKLRAAINAKRDECVDGGAYVPEIDKWVDTDDKGRATLIEIKADFDLNGKDNTYTLICADNTAHVIHYEEFRAVWNAVKSLKEKMFENAYMHKVLLENSENPQDYDWSIGWSETYEDYLKKQK